jgi:hypothetical protein
MEKDTQASDGIEEGTCLGWCGGNPAPIEDPLGQDILITVLLSVAGELQQNPVRRIKLKAETTLHGNVTLDVVTQHDASPGHG